MQKETHVTQLGAIKMDLKAPEINIIICSSIYFFWDKKLIGVCFFVAIDRIFYKYWRNKINK